MCQGERRALGWFASRGWEAFEFQRECWAAQRAGRSGLVHAPTGMGKTHAAWLGCLIEAVDRSDEGGGVRVVWLTPLRALAGDTAEALREACAGMGVGWRVEVRTGDTPSLQKKRQRRSPPECLVTTPESLTILLSYPDGARLFGGLRCVVADEWHELMGSKRGVQAELAMARLRRIAPGVRTWGLSATLANTEEAARVLVGADAPEPVLVRGIEAKRIEIETLLPDEIEGFPWSGHLGLRLAEKVARVVERARSTLIFTNTRSQAEAWFRELLRIRPEWIGEIALHHGSLDRSIRSGVEAMLRSHEGGLRCVVCTSSLDLGVDFTPVDQVVQVGSPKGIARLMQRAGRSGHQPGAVSRIVGVPTHAIELVEFGAAREAIDAKRIEGRRPIEKPLDVLSQHLVTMAAGGGFVEEELREEVRSTHAYRSLGDDEWAWVLDFVHGGGPALAAYPRFARIRVQNGRWGVSTPKVGSEHRMGIGTIVADTSVPVRYRSGRTLGTIEESFIDRLRIGDRFVFAGRVVELERFHDGAAIVRKSSRTKGAVPRWNGGRMPLSTMLSDALLDRLGEAGAGVYRGEEMERVRPLLERQAAMSVVPRPGMVLIERVETREGVHWFVFPFAGRLVHEGLGALLSLRVSRLAPVSVRATANDYGFELMTETPVEIDEAGWRELLSPDELLDDLLEAANASQMARRHFREIARIAGLTVQGYPGEKRRGSYLQASSEMYFDVLTEFDPENMLLSQSRREVLEGQLEFERLREALERMAGWELEIVRPAWMTPMSFPIYAESLRATMVSSEQWEHRLRRLIERHEERAAVGVGDA